MGPDRGALLGRDYWLVLATPKPATTAADIELRADSAEEAAKIAATDPFVTAGLRTAEVFGWRVNEGAIQLRVSLGTGTYTWG